MRMMFAAALLMAASSAAQARVEYAINLTASEHHAGQVSIDFPTSAGPFLDVKMPAWRTGRYQILNLANGVRGFTATDAQGRALRWEKIDKSTWRVHLARPGAIRVGYEIYGNELGLRSRHIDDSHAYLDASAVFMYADPFRGDDVSVALKVPAGWTSVSGMPSTGAHRFAAPNWDILVDSPIETGINKVHRFAEGGRDYEVVFWGAGNYDAGRIATDLRKIVGEADSIWSKYPFQRYVFMIHATDGARGATEHRNSTVIQIPRHAFQPRKAYLDFLSTASHEFIHTWNVKAYRGVGLVPYDYQKENYSDLLWIAEGSTSYFEDHLLVRAGVMTSGEYLERLGGAIDQYRHTPGNRVQSVAAASFDAWMSSSVSGDRAKNASADIYAEGAVVSWLLDIALLEQTRGRISYRDVHEALYRRFNADQRGFSSADVRGILKQLTGTSWEGWWARNVDAPAAVDFDRLLNSVGLRLSHADAKGAAAQVAWAGWSGEDAGGGIRLNSVERGSPAWNAGFTTDDILVALDGKRVTKARFDAAIAEYRPGDTIAVDYFRRDQLGKKTITLTAAPKNAAKIVPVEKPTGRQKALFQRWLLIPYSSL